MKKKFKLCFLTLTVILTFTFFTEVKEVYSLQQDFSVLEREFTESNSEFELPDVREFTFIGIFILGLALNLTPCVYPMLAVTASVFSKGREYGRLKSFLRALVYVLGISTMYSLLGVVAAFTGGLFGGILQSGYVLGAIAALFFLLSLSMFGFFEIRVPQSLINRLGGRSTAGTVGVYLSGLFVGIFAAPCIGPPIIGLLTVVGHRGEVYFGFLIFFVLSLGLGFPYLLMGTFTGMIKKIPQSGEWMVWFRRLMGLLLLALGFFYLSLVITRELIYIFIPIILVAGGIYLGFLDKAGMKSSFFIWVKRVIGTAAAATGLFFFLSVRDASVRWTAWSLEAQKDAIEREEPSVIYFSADWCIPCLEMELRTFSEEDVIEAFSSFTVFRVDLTDYESRESADLRERFDIRGVPTIIFLDAKGNEIRDKRTTGFVSSERLLEIIETVKENGEEDRNLFEIEEDVEFETIMVSENKWIQPGRPFYAGVLFKLPEGWHTYWKNPGESGEAALIEWNLPEGYEKGKLNWPAPQKYEEGPLITYGHEDFLLLTKKITPPEYLEPGSEEVLGADIKWYVCREMCIPRKDSDTISLKVKDAAAPEEEKWRDYFEETRKMLPVKKEGWKFSAKSEGNEAVLVLETPSKNDSERIYNSTFFPSQREKIKPGEYFWEKNSNGYKMRMDTEVPVRGEILKGVLVLDSDQQPRVLEVIAELEN